MIIQTDQHERTSNINASIYPGLERRNNIAIDPLLMRIFCWVKILLAEKVRSTREEKIMAPIRKSLSLICFLFVLIEYFPRSKKMMDETSDSSLMKFFRRFLYDFYSHMSTWKSCAYVIYHLEHFIIHLDNYQLKTFLHEHFQIFSRHFISFVKSLITIEIRSSKENSFVSNSSSDLEYHSEIEEHIENLKIQFNHFKDAINSTKERFNLCQTDLNAVENLLRMSDEIKFERKIFDRDEQKKISLLALQRDLAEKSTKTDLIQMKIYIDNQMKKLLELNKENARELERIKFLKTSTCQTRHIQSILSTNSSSHSKSIRRRQTFRPYITFLLNQIRTYRRQTWVIIFRNQY